MGSDWLPADYTRCVNDECPQKNKCLRYRGKNNIASWLSYACFEYEFGCDFFMPVDLYPEGE